MTEGSQALRAVASHGNVGLRLYILLLLFCEVHDARPRGFPPTELKGTIYSRTIDHLWGMHLTA